jgi:hypothetical protein
VTVPPEKPRVLVVYFTYSKPAENGQQRTTLARGRLDNSGLNSGLNDVKDLFSGEPTAVLGGSRIVFDRAGMIFMTTGAATGTLAQDPNSDYGKVLRFRDDGTVPADNPFVGLAGYKPEIYSLGHRDQLGLTIHPETGAVLSNENGPNGGDEINIIENGFLNEFKLAQANLQANIAAGKGSTFAYTGAAGTQPLPIFLGYLNGSKLATDATKYTGTNWTNTTLVQSMYPLNPNPYTAANNIWGTSSFRTNGLAAGYPSNFWVANPEINHGYVVGGNVIYSNGPFQLGFGGEVNRNVRNLYAANGPNLRDTDWTIAGSYNFGTIMAGFGPLDADAAAIADLAHSRHVLAASNSVAAVEQAMSSLCVTQEGGKPKIFVNLSVAQKEGIRFSSSLLKLVTLVR